MRKMGKFLLSLFIFLSIIPQVALAQAINIGGLEISISLLTILIFSLIILFLFIGVKGPKIGLPIGMILFALFLFIVFFLPSFSGITFEVPSDWQRFELPDIFKSFFQILGLSREWLWMPAFLYLFLIPFSVIFILVYAFLKELNLFPTSPNLARTIAFLVTFLTIPFGLFAKFINVIFAVFIGFYAVILFAAMFILTAFFMTYRRVSIEYGVAVEAKREAQIKKLYSDIASINEKLAKDIPEQEKLKLLDERRRKARAIQMLGGTVSPEWLQ